VIPAAARAADRGAVGPALAAALLALFLAVTVTVTAPAASPAQETWAERLGYPPGRRVLILHADDVGMCRAAVAR